MRAGMFWLVGLVLITFQTTLLQELPKWLGTPDLVFALVTFLAYRFDWLRGIFLASIFGWMMDVISGIYPGMYVVQYILVFIILSSVTKNSPIKESAYQIPLVGVVYLLSQLVLYVALTVTVSEELPRWSWNSMLRETIILTVAAIPCFVMFNSFYEYLQKKRASSRIVRRKSGNRFR